LKQVQRQSQVHLGQVNDCYLEALGQQEYIYLNRKVVRCWKLVCKDFCLLDTLNYLNLILEHASVLELSLKLKGDQYHNQQLYNQRMKPLQQWLGQHSLDQ
jgi:hypothetical protein